MIIDGLRWDFVAGPIGEIAMPITRSLIDDDEACLLQAKAASPTVTMPRLKVLKVSDSNSLQMRMSVQSTNLTGNYNRRCSNVCGCGIELW